MIGTQRWVWGEGDLMYLAVPSLSFTAKGVTQALVYFAGLDVLQAMTI